MPYSRTWLVPTTGTLLAGLAATLVACAGGESGGASGTGYAADGDTGAASPATQQTLSPNPSMGESTQALQKRAGTSMMAGDSGRPTLTPADSGRNPGVNQVPRQPITGESSGAAGRVPASKRPATGP